MVTQNLDSVTIDHNINNIKQIKIKQTQLKIAQDSNMPLVAEVLQRQLEELQQESNFQAIMSLLDE